MNFENFMTDNAAIQKAMEERHSVRQYTDEPIAEDVVQKLNDAIKTLNEDHWTDLQLVLDEPHAFTGRKAKYGHFVGARNYIALVGPECKELQEVLGFAGEKLVLYAKALGLDSCWVGVTFRMTNHAFRVDLANKFEGVISLGYGQTHGSPHKSVSPETISKDYSTAPDWFKAGVDASLLAPTALNQQKFRFELKSETPDGTQQVHARTKRGPFSKMDLGIAKLHFELGADYDSFSWV